MVNYCQTCESVFKRQTMKAFSKKRRDRMVSLPKNEPRDIKKDLRHKVLLYGDSYVGKTTVADGFPNPVIISTDGNYKYVKSPAVMVRTRADIEKILEELKKGDHDFETVVIDVINQVYDIYRTEVLLENKVQHEQEMGGFAIGYNKVRDPWKALITEFASLPYNIVFIAHANKKTETDRLGRETTTIEPQLPDKLYTHVAGLVDITSLLDVIKVPSETNEGEYDIKHVMYLNTVNTDQKGGSRLTFHTNVIESSYENYVAEVEKAFDNPVNTIKASVPVDTKEQAKTTSRLADKAEKAPKLKPLKTKGNE